MMKPSRMVFSSAVLLACAFAAFASADERQAGPPLPTADPVLPAPPVTLDFKGLRFHGQAGPSGEWGGGPSPWQAISALPEFKSLDEPVVLAGVDPARLSEGQKFTLEGAYRNGVPIAILHPSAAQLAALVDVLDSEATTPSDTAGLDALAFVRDAGGDDAALFVGGAPAEAPRRLERLTAWLRDRLAARGGGASLQAKPVQPTSHSLGAGPADLDQLMEAIQREVYLPADSATHKVIVNAWAAHSFETGDDFYIFRLDTTSSGANYYDSGWTLSGSKWVDAGRDNGRICDARQDGTACARRRYLRFFNVRVNPAQSGVGRIRATPSSDRESEQYEVSTGWSINGKVNAGWTQEKGLSGGVELGFGVRVDRKRTVTIKDATVVSTTGGDGLRESAGWRLEMPDPGTEDVGACVARALRQPFPIQRGSHDMEQWAIYRVPASARAGQGGRLGVKVRIEAQENTRNLTWVWNGFDGNAQGCDMGGCNCNPNPNTWKTGSWANEVELSFPLAANELKPVPPPAITSLAPATGGVGTRVGLRGSGFKAATEVRFGTEKATFNVDNDGQITALAPAGKGATLVSVISPGGISNTQTFTYQ